MNPQVKEAAKRAAILLALAAIPIVFDALTGVIPGEYLPIASAIFATLGRVLEGYRDGKRADKGEVIASDVQPTGRIYFDPA